MSNYTPSETQAWIGLVWFGNSVCVYIYIHYITLHYITLHYITQHYTTLHYITLHYITLHCIAYITYIRYIHIHVVSHPEHCHMNMISRGCFCVLPGLSENKKVILWQNEQVNRWSSWKWPNRNRWCLPCFIGDLPCFYGKPCSFFKWPLKLGGTVHR